VNTAPHALADIPLRWMIEQIMRTETSVLWDYKEFERWNIPADIGQVKPSTAGVASTSEDATKQDAEDAVQKLTDELFKNPLWWILEIFPFPYTYWNQQGNRSTSWW
jgi:hypothetical protein